MTNQPRKLYGDGDFSRYLTTIVRAEFTRDSLPLAGNAGTIDRERALQVFIEAPKGYGNSVVIAHDAALRFLTEQGNWGSIDVHVADGHIVPGLHGASVNVLYQGRNPVALEPTRVTARDLAAVYTDAAREQVGDAAREAGRVAKKGLRRGLEGLASMLGDPHKK